MQLPIQEKEVIWKKLGDEWLLDLSELEEVLTLDDISGAIDRILAGEMIGRGVIHL